MMSASTPDAEAHGRVEIDGQPYRCSRARRSSTACRKVGSRGPTSATARPSQPANVCRVCVVEIEGARVLAPSCSRKAEAGHEGAHRLRARAPLAQARAGVPRVVRRPSTAPDAEAYCEEYDGQPERYGPPAPPDPLRDRKRTGHHVEPDGLTAATVHAPIKVDNELYVRDYSKCILCYKCVDACGDQHQNTFAITVAGRGFDARISTEYVVALPESACVYCGNCIAVCPTGALMFKCGARPARGRARGTRRGQTVTTTICPYCGVGCNLELHVQDNEIVRVTEPRRPRRDPGQPLHQGPVRVPARAGSRS